MQEKAMEMNMPECPIWIEKIYIDEIFPLEWDHMFHTHWVAQHVKVKINDRSFPILCPDPSCKKELSQVEIENLWEGEDYK